MSEQPELRRALEFEAFWDRLLSGRTGDSFPLIEPETANAAEIVHGLSGEVKANPDVQAALWASLQTDAAEHVSNPEGTAASDPHSLTNFQIGKELSQMNGNAALASPGGQVSSVAIQKPNAANPGGQVAKPNRVEQAGDVRRRPIASYIALAALLAAVFALIFFTFFRDSNSAIPPVQETPVGTPTSEWNQWRGNASRDGYSSTPGPEGNLAIAWTFKAAVMNSAVATDIAVYTTSVDGIVYALDRATGAQQWAFDLGAVSPSPSVFPSPVVDSGVVYAVSAAGGVFALRAEDGSLMRNVQTEAAVRISPAFLDGGLYMGDVDGNVYRINAETGSIDWQGDLSAPIDSSGFAVSEELALIADANGILFAFNSTDGTQLWAKSVGAGARVPVVSSGIAYISIPNIALVALDLQSGAELWRKSVPEGGEMRLPSVANGVVVVNVEGEATIALNATTGELLWSTPHNATGSNVTIADDTAFTSDNDNKLIAYDLATGAERAETMLPQFIISPPTVYEGILYGAGAFGDLYAIGTRVEGSPEAGIPATPNIALPPINATPSTESALELGSGQVVWQAELGNPFVGEDIYLAAANDGSLVTLGPTVNELDSTGSRVSTWGAEGEEPGQFNFIEDVGGGAWGDIAQSPDGSWWVAVCGNQRIEHFDADHVWIGGFGAKGESPGEFTCPSAIAIGSDGDLYVADQSAGTLQRFHQDGTFVEFLGPGGGTAAIAFLPDGRMVVADNGSTRVWLLAENGDPIRYVGEEPGDAPGQFSSPADVATDADGNIYVADQLTDFVTVLSPDGALIGIIDIGDALGQPVAGLLSVIPTGHNSVYVLAYGDALSIVVEVSYELPAATGTPIAGD